MNFSSSIGSTHSLFSPTFFLFFFPYLLAFLLPLLPPLIFLTSYTIRIILLIRDLIVGLAFFF